MKKRASRKPATCVTLREFAAELKTPIPTLQGWIKRDWWTWPKRAPWSRSIVPDVLRAAADSRQIGRPEGATNKNPSKSADLRLEKLRQEIRKLRAQADTAETELARERGKLLDAAEVEREWSSIGVLVRNATENLTSQIIPLALTAGMPHEAAGRFQQQVEELISGILRHLNAAETETSDRGEAEVPGGAVPAGAVEPLGMGRAGEDPRGRGEQRAGAVPV